MNWRIELGPDERREDELTDRLVEHNLEASEVIRRRFERTTSSRDRSLRTQLTRRTSCFGPAAATGASLLLDRTEELTAEPGAPVARPHPQAQHLGVPGAGLLRPLRVCHLRSRDRLPAGTRAAGVFAADKAGIDGADALVAIMDGPAPDSGTCWEVGYAFDKKPTVLVRTDIRALAGDAGEFSPMTQAATIRLDLPAASTTEVASAIVEALARVGGRA